MRNGEQTYVKHLALQHRLLPLMPSATYFFLTAKKSRQKMPLSNAERLAQRKSLCGSHNMRWPAKEVARGRLVARRTYALCAMVLSDGFLGCIFAMASLNDWVRSRGSLAGNIAHHMRTTENQFSIRGVGPDNLRLLLSGQPPFSAFATLSDELLHRRFVDRFQNNPRHTGICPKMRDMCRYPARRPATP